MLPGELMNVTDPTAPFARVVDRRKLDGRET